VLRWQDFWLLRPDIADLLSEDTQNSRQGAAAVSWSLNKALMPWAVATFRRMSTSYLLSAISMIQPRSQRSDPVAREQSWLRLNLPTLSSFRFDPYEVTPSALKSWFRSRLAGVRPYQSIDRFQNGEVVRDAHHGDREQIVVERERR
jgi:hypothetical protein